MSHYYSWNQRHFTKEEQEAQLAEMRQRANENLKRIKANAPVRSHAHR